MNLAFTQIIKKVFQTRVFPALSDIVDRVVNNVSIKGKISLAEVQLINSEIHCAVMKALFSPVDTHKVSQHDQDSDDASDDQENSRHLTWLVSQFVDEYREADFDSSPRLRCLIEEYIDLLETEYFESALYDLVDASHTQFFEVFLARNLTTDSLEKPELPLLPDSTSDSGPVRVEAVFKEGGPEVVPMLKLMTHLYVLH